MEPDPSDFPGAFSHHAATNFSLQASNERVFRKGEENVRIYGCRRLDVLEYLGTACRTRLDVSLADELFFQSSKEAFRYSIDAPMCCRVVHAGSSRPLAVTAITADW
jgi:hypothetical protein